MIDGVLRTIGGIGILYRFGGLHSLTICSIPTICFWFLLGVLLPVFPLRYGGNPTTTRIVCLGISQLYTEWCIYIENNQFYIGRDPV